MKNRLVDAFDRPVNYLRISVTDRCNLHCRYCAPHRPARMAREDLLTLEEIIRLVRVAVRLGVTKVRLTGGEPLCRRGVTTLIAELRRLEGIEDLSLTTNGTRLARMAASLREAGLERINISLDTLDRGKFRDLTGVDRFDQVWEGVCKALELGFSPVKINTVVMRGFNDDELEQLAALARRYPLHVRFIEYMPIGTDPRTARAHFVGIDEVAARVGRFLKLTPRPAGANDGPAQRFRIAEGPGEIGLIGSMSHHFCRSCNRIRLTANGFLRPCLLSDEQLDLFTPLRRGCRDDVLAALMVQSLQRKKASHQVGFEADRAVLSQMVSIGG